MPIGVRPRIAHEQVLGAGDAVGFVDPLTGKGIPYALLSSRLAGDLVGKAVDAGSADGLEEAYIEGLQALFLDKLARKRALIPEIFASDSRLMAFLQLWQHHRSTEIVEQGLLIPDAIEVPGLVHGSRIPPSARL